MSAPLNYFTIVNDLVNKSGLIGLFVKSRLRCIERSFTTSLNHLGKNYKIVTFDSGRFDVLLLSSVELYILSNGKP